MDHFSKFVTCVQYMMMQKNDPYSKLFSTLSEVRRMCILSQLNIRCTRLVKPYYTKMTIHPLFTIHMLRPIYMFSVWWISSKRCDPYIKTFSTLSGVRTVFWILPQLDILCTSAVKWYYAKKTIHRSRDTCFPRYYLSSWKLPCSLDLNLVNFLLCRALQQNLYRQNFRDIDHLKRILLHRSLGPTEGVPDWLL